MEKMEEQMLKDFARGRKVKVDKLLFERQEGSPGGSPRSNEKQVHYARGVYPKKSLGPD